MLEADKQLESRVKDRYIVNLRSGKTGKRCSDKEWGERGEKI